MSQRKHIYTPASNAILRWLTDAGPGLPQPVRDVLLSELFASSRAVLLAICNGLLLNAAALLLERNPAFLVFMAIDVLLTLARLLAIREAARAARRGTPTFTDLYLLTAILWCALQGAMAFTAMRTANPTLQVLFAASIIGLLGPICARTYPAPRLALLFVSLCLLPFVAGAALCGKPALLLMIIQTPIFLSGSMMVIRRFHTMTISALRAQHDSQDRARHDPLTGLLNRSGLAERVSRCESCVLFYLDLDGFKQINDRFGHQAGDTLLQAVAGRLRSSTRAQDAVARIGGDEFVVVAHDMTPDEAPRFAEAIIRQISDRPCMVEPEGAPGIGISVGFACAPEDGSTLDELNRNADSALYDAKLAGKGTCRRFRHPARRSEDARIHCRAAEWNARERIH